MDKRTLTGLEILEDIYHLNVYLYSNKDHKAIITLNDNLLTLQMTADQSYLLNDEIVTMSISQLQQFVDNISEDDWQNILSQVDLILED